MYTVITHYDDWERRPWDEVVECHTKEELEEVLKEIGPDQNTPIKIQTKVLDNSQPIFKKEIPKAKMKCPLCGEQVREFGTEKSKYEFEMSEHYESKLILECKNVDCDYFVGLTPEFNIEDVGSLMRDIHELICKRIK